MQYCSLNPASGETIKQFPFSTAAQIEAGLDSADRTFKQWRRTPACERAQLFGRLAAELEKRIEPLARLISLEMGKPISQSLAEIRKCAGGCRFFAEKGPQWLADEERPTEASRSFVTFEPIGVIFSILPWNFPFWQFFRFAAPAIVAGNTVIFKHAPNVPQIAEQIAELFSASGFPSGLVQNLFLSNEQAGAVIADRRIAAVTITGSSRAGREVAAAAGRSLKKAVLELGGTDPFIVFSDADIDSAIEIAMTARFANCGQVCISAKRFYIEQPVFEQFASAFVEKVKALRLGDPMSHSTDLGPIARADLLHGLQSQFQRSVGNGDRPVLGADNPQLPEDLRRGFYFQPAVFLNPKPNSPLLQEEIFGPIAALIPFKSEAEAVRLANDSPYGLGASVWTGDKNRMIRLPQQLDFGSVFVNGMVQSDPRLPFGGIKESGYGRELSVEGMREFTNIKTIWIK